MTKDTRSKVLPDYTLGQLASMYRMNASGLPAKPWPEAGRKAVEDELRGAGLLPDLENEEAEAENDLFNTLLKHRPGFAEFVKKREAAEAAKKPPAKKKTKKK